MLDKFFKAQATESLETLETELLINIPMLKTFSKKVCITRKILYNFRVFYILKNMPEK